MELQIEESIDKIEDSRSLKKKEVKVQPFFLPFLCLYRGGSTKLSKPTKPKLLKERKKKNDKQVTRSRVETTTLVNSVQKRGAKTHKHHSSSYAVVLCYVNQHHISISFLFFSFSSENIERKRRDERSEPESTSLFEKRHQSAIDMRGHDSVHCPNKLPADEDDRNSGGASQEPH